MTADVMKVVGEIEALYAKATPGKWVYDGSFQFHDSLQRLVVVLGSLSGEDDERKANAGLLITLVNNWPALKSTLEAAQAEATALREALTFYAEGNHFIRDDAWDTVSGEPTNFWCDEAGTATVEDGSIAKLAISQSTALSEAGGKDAKAG